MFYYHISRSTTVLDATSTQASFTQSSQVASALSQSPVYTLYPHQDETSSRTTDSFTAFNSQLLTTYHSSTVTSHLESSRVPSPTPTLQLITQTSSYLSSLKSSIILLPSPSKVTTTVLSSLVIDAEYTAIFDRESTAIVSSESYNQSSFVVEASPIKATGIGIATASAAPPHDSTIHIATPPSPPTSSSYLDAHETLRPTEKDTTDAPPTGYRDLGFAVASVVVAVVLLIGSVLAVSVAGLVMHWRDNISNRSGTRGLEKRSDSFRYTQSY